MTKLKLIEATEEDLDCIRAFYWKVIDSSEALAEILQWKKNLYPADSDWLDYIHKKEMYLIYEAERLVGAVALTSSQSDGYKQINWRLPAREEEVLVTHLLAVDPEQQGKGIATAALNEIVAIAKNRGKKALRLDAIETNVPAQRLYEKYGFKKCGWAKEYYESVGVAGFYFYEYDLM